MPDPGFETVCVDDCLLVLNKPSGLLAVPGRGEDKQDCLSSRVQARYPEALIVHRLDMATSGLMLMARSAEVQRRLSKAFAERLVHKRYVAVVTGDMASLADPAGSWNLIDLPIMLDWPRRPLRVIDRTGGKPSQTRWQIESQDSIAGTSRVLLEPITGRSHQLRVHLQALGHAILGDALYAGPVAAAAANRLMLHASSLAFAHPESGEWMAFESVPPF
jgi:tRNA pseudouridine32 synthase/23S rRNA pseudouridine746 synthase